MAGRNVETESMQGEPRPSVARTRPRVRSIALPTEHGGWGLTLEPIILGLLVAATATAWEISAAAVGVFLARRPVKLVTTDLVRRRWYPRTTVALLFSALYGAVALAGIAGALVTADGPFWIPVVAALPFALVALRADARTESRGLVPELSGAIAMGAAAPAIALGSGWELGPALGLWLVLAARDLASIVLVRGQIRRLHGRAAGTKTISSVHVGSVVVVGIGAALGVVPWLGVAAIGLVGVVAVISMSTPVAPARVIGWTQMGLGLAVVLLTAAGVHLGI